MNRTEDMLTVVSSYASQPGGPSTRGRRMYIYGRVSLILFSLTSARQPSWPIPLGQPVAHTPLAASGPYPWTASGPYQRQPSRPIPTSTTVLPLRVHAGVVSDPKRSLPGRFQSMFFSSGDSVLFSDPCSSVAFYKGHQVLY